MLLFHPLTVPKAKLGHCTARAPGTKVSVSDITPTIYPSVSVGAIEAVRQSPWRTLCHLSLERLPAAILGPDPTAQQALRWLLLPTANLPLAVIASVTNSARQGSMPARAPLGLLPTPQRTSCAARRTQRDGRLHGTVGVPQMAHRSVP